MRKNKEKNLASFFSQSFFSKSHISLHMLMTLYSVRREPNCVCFWVFLDIYFTVYSDGAFIFAQETWMVYYYCCIAFGMLNLNYKLKSLLRRKCMNLNFPQSLEHHLMTKGKKEYTCFVQTQWLRWSAPNFRAEILLVPKALQYLPVRSTKLQSPF